ncbi:hypothetical protein QUF80_05630 [Desulfococcaceae bacterium HSG8]|nr:hypothetical protein [Desulfococcaceae bacterium HSG8]
MASNFQILSYRKSGNLHLKLMGDFDGSSAHELINILETHCRYVFRVFIHTGSLRSVHPFGREVFRNNLSALNRQSGKLIFTGKNGDKIAPERNIFFKF